METDSEIRMEILETFMPGDKISIPLIQKHFRCGYNSAKRVFDGLVTENLIKRHPKYKNGASTIA